MFTCACTCTRQPSFCFFFFSPGGYTPQVLRTEVPILCWPHQASVACVRCGSLNRISRDGTEIATACTMSSQLETFTKWWNSHLEPRGYPISNLVEDVHSGFLPFRLLEALENHPPTPVVRGKAKILGTAVVAKPQIKMQRMDNHSRFFAFLTEEKKIKVLLPWLPSR